MMREVVVLNEAQTAKLVTMKGDVLDKDLAKRAQIILELSKGRSVREIAAEVGLNKDAVTRWKKRFLDGGIDALYSRHGGGVAAQVVVEDLRERIRTAIDTKTDGTWTRQGLADDIGVPVSQINKELEAMGITLSRNTSWSFRTADSIHSRWMCIAGVYLSSRESCIALCTSRSEMLTGEETFITRNRMLADELKAAAPSLIDRHGQRQPPRPLRFP